MLGLGVVTAEVIIHEPVTIDRFGTRKALAEACWRVVSEGVATLLTGRPQRYPAPDADTVPKGTDLALPGTVPV
jgi:1-acyl-sn-glycerol-3-phosphate acyltransferase